MKIDLSFLFKRPEKTISAMLIIEPLAPLSMVSTMPGAFYKTLSEPSKFHIFGAFENALGWHFDKKMRRDIRKKVAVAFKKQKMDSPLWEDSDVGYLPLIEPFIEIRPNPVLIKTPKMFYKDIWKQMRKRSDAHSHPNGTMNLSYEIIPRKMELERKENGTVTDKAITAFYATNRERYPMYYTSAGNREFVVLLQGAYYYKLEIPENLFEMLQQAFYENNISYLGTNEGWVNLKINRL